MPEITSREMNIALDMHGCPNRCRHCWLGCLPNGCLSEEDVRWAAAQFRDYLRPAGDEPFLTGLNVVTWVREPDFSDDYERLYDLEVELSDVKTYRAEWELLSIWRLARDGRYAEWARKIGVRTCQISFFGLAETNDWFHRRKGAFHDSLIATERLLDAGIMPRWQWFLTKKIIPDLGELLRLVERMRLRDRVGALGGEFQLFVHTPSPTGEARKIEHLRPNIDDVRSVPNEIIESSRKHLGWKEPWHAEARLVSEILAEDDHLPCAYHPPTTLFFHMKSNWDVFANIGTAEHWWKLGNLKTDSVGDILDAYEQNRPPGLKVNYTVPRKELARRFGDLQGRVIYDVKSDLAELWVERYCEEAYRRSQPGSRTFRQ